jgi:hypothetical protein
MKATKIIADFCTKSRFFVVALHKQFGSILRSMFDNFSAYSSGVAGGTASGKSTVCKRIIEKLGQAEINDQQRQVRKFHCPSLHETSIFDTKLLITQPSIAHLESFQNHHAS